MKQENCLDSNDELYHWGRKGMKRGEHRFCSHNPPCAGAKVYTGDDSSGEKRSGTADSSKTGSSKPKSVKDMTDDELSARNKRMRLERDYGKLSKETRQKSKLEATTDSVRSLSEQVERMKGQNNKALEKQRAAKEKLDLTDMTDEQLRKSINRAQLERQYNDLYAKSPEVSRGRQFLTDVLDAGGTALAFTGTALSIALAIQQLRGKA